MKITHLAYSDIRGGANRSAYRIYKALQEFGAFDVEMKVATKYSDDWTVESPKRKFYSKELHLKQRVSSQVGRFLKTRNSVIHSSSIFPSHWPNFFKRSDTDIVHLHWVASEMLSISDIGRIHKPIVWTLHDMWAFCGAEHYTEEDRWQEGYFKGNRPNYERGFDLNKWSWNRKLRYWKYPAYIVAPSHWLASCVKKSALMHNWPVFTIPYAIDNAVWKPIDKGMARKILNLSVDSKLLLFGAMGGGQDKRKGFDLLMAALQKLDNSLARLELLVFGQEEPRETLDLGFPVHYMGSLYDDISLRIAYSAADAMVISSRQDNLPNTGIEAHACGTPVIAFDTSGLPDIVEHLKTGYLAQGLDCGDLSKGIMWTLNNPERCHKLGVEARRRAVKLWSPDVIAKQYHRIYESINHERA